MRARDHLEDRAQGGRRPARAVIGGRRAIRDGVGQQSFLLMDEPPDVVAHGDSTDRGQDHDGENGNSDECQRQAATEFADPEYAPIRFLKRGQASSRFLPLAGVHCYAIASRTARPLVQLSRYGRSPRPETVIAYSPGRRG